MRYYFNWGMCVIVTIVLSGLYSCKSDVSEVNIIISPDSLGIHAAADDILVFSIEANALSELLTYFKITQQTTKTGVKALLDTIASGQKMYFQYAYKIPADIQEKEIKLSFIAGTASETAVVNKYIFLDSIGTSLRESSAHVMYSGSNHSYNTFSVTERKVVSIEQDSLLADIYDYRNKSIPDAQLSREWRSLTGLRFARFNDFNYAEATTQSLQKSYENSVKNTSVSDLSINDVILIGYTDKALGVIKIIAVYDEEDYGNDRYVFNLKY